MTDSSNPSPTEPAALPDTKVMQECLTAILTYEPGEICYDEYAYRRLVKSYRDAARAGLGMEPVSNG